MTAVLAGGVDLADAIARVLVGPFVWRTAMPPQGGPELDAAGADRVRPSSPPHPDRPREAVAQTETAVAGAGCTRVEAHAECVSDGAVSAGYTGPEQGKRDEVAAAARARFADVLARGGAPSIRTLRAEYGIGQARAQRVQAVLRRPHSF